MTKLKSVLIFTLCFIVGYIGTALDRPMVSVVIPTYNRADSLPRAIDSVLAQSFQDFELIIVDDCSTDKTQRILKKYQAKNNKITVITHETNQGVGAARNTGNAYARGTYIIVLDSDDYALPNMLHDSVQFMQKHPDIDIGIPAKFGFNKNNPDYLFSWHYPVYDFFSANFLGNVGNIFKREFITRHHITYKEHYTCAEDYDFWVQMLLKGAKIAKIEDKNHYPIYTVAFKSSSGGYGNACIKYSDIIRSEIADFLKLPHNPVNACSSLKKWLSVHPDTFLSHTKQQAINTLCPPPNTKHLFASHNNWSDYLIFSDDMTHVNRVKNNDRATVITYIPHQKLMLKWDNFGTETFVYDKDTQAYHNKP